jgi:fermentation-respiration switch protein FrsA (DUF1100 family)
VREGWDGTYAPAVVAAVQADPERGLELAAVTGIPAEGLDPATLGAAVADILWYNVLGTLDAQERLGGQAYDNGETIYQGSSDDTALNAGVARFTADPLARAELERFETSGDPSVPISILHTTGDPIVPFFHQQRYAEKVEAQGAGGLLERTDVARFGHCAFTSAELLGAFGALPQ